MLEPAAKCVSDKENRNPVEKIHSVCGSCNNFFFAGCLSPATQFPCGMQDSAIVAGRPKESNENVRLMFGFPRNEQWKGNFMFRL